MPFKTPKPFFDAEQVRLVEEDMKMDHWTRIETVDRPNYDGMVVSYALGRMNKSYPRPMIQTLSVQCDAFRSAPQFGCPCTEFHRTNTCELHPELRYDTDAKGWVHPDTDIVEDTRSDIEIEADTIIGLYQRAIQATQPVHTYSNFVLTDAVTQESLEEHFTRLGRPVTNPLADGDTVSTTIDPATGIHTTEINSEGPDGTAQTIVYEMDPDDWF